MKNSFVLTLLLLSSVLSISLFAEEQFDYDAFGRLPVQKDGRVKPIDTVARNALLVLRGKQTIKKGSTKIPAIQWFLDVVFNPDRADDHKVFRVDHPEVLALDTVLARKNTSHSTTYLSAMKFARSMMRLIAF